MKTSRSTLIVGIVLAAVLLSSAAILAQTAEPTSPASSFTDGRINGDTDLGGLAIYCVDQNGSPRVNTFQNGGIEVWGPSGNEFIALTADQLRGSVEIPQPPATPEALMTEQATEEMSEATQESSEMVTPEASATVQPPVLLAQAAGPNGAVWFIGLGSDQFELQGTDETGKFFTYTWTDCAPGSLQAGAVPLFTPVPPSASSTEMPTAEVTAAATTSS